MPKNTTGGKGHKKDANKGFNQIQQDYKIRSEMEVEGYVEKILGNGMLQVNSTDGRYVGLRCTIRGKFKGRNKSRNRIETNGYVVVGLREWETPYKTCDLLFVCNGKHKTETDEYGEDDGIDFINDEDNDGIVLNASSEEYLVLDDSIIDNINTDDIDIDDI